MAQYSFLCYFFVDETGAALEPRGNVDAAVASAAWHRISEMNSGMLILYELAGKADRRFSPFCWRARLALAHKGLSATCVPVRFTDKETIAFSGQGRVPILVDGEKIVTESWQIACHLENFYPERPSLFGGPGAESLAHFADAWATRTLFPLLVRVVLCDVLEHLDPVDADYIRSSREQKLGITWEEMREQRGAHLRPLREGLSPLRLHLRHMPFLAGEQAAYADYSVFALFQWARMISPYSLLEPTDPVYAWRRKMLDLFDGFAAAAPGYSCDAGSPTIAAL